VLRYNVPIGYAVRDIPAGSWVHERLLKMPAARELDNLPIATVKPQPLSPLEGYTFEGYRNGDGSVGTRNILAITTTVQCVAGVVDFAVKRIKEELLPRFPNVDDVVGLEHTYGCGVAIDAPDAIVPIRTLRNITLNPNFGGEVMVVSLGCEKLQPERLLPPGTIPIVDERSVADVGVNAEPDLDVIVLQSERHVGFMSMIESIMASALVHLERLNDRRRETVPASELVVGVRKRSWIIGQGFRQAEPTHLDYLIDRQRFEHRHQAVRTTRGPAAGDHKCRLYWRRSAMVIAGPHASFRP
jgi:galactarate dehydratase